MFGRRFVSTTGTTLKLDKKQNLKHSVKKTKVDVTNSKVTAYNQNNLIFLRSNSKKAETERWFIETLKKDK